MSVQVEIGQPSTFWYEGDTISPTKAYSLYLMGLPFQSVTSKLPDEIKRKIMIMRPSHPTATMLNNMTVDLSKEYISLLQDFHKNLNIYKSELDANNTQTGIFGEYLDTRASEMNFYISYEKLTDFIYDYRNVLTNITPKYRRIIEKIIDNKKMWGNFEDYKSFHYL
jgi:hypothetical protein|tara:strand:- start:3044 stop:3544 length:501 start_codon:yes stop_codon:yes gene_type:complete